MDRRSHPIAQVWCPVPSGLCEITTSTATAVSTTPTDKGSAKFDHLITANHRLAFLYNVTAFRRAVGPAGPPGLPLPLWNGGIQTFDTETYRGTHDWTISPRLLNHLS